MHGSWPASSDVDGRLIDPRFGTPSPPYLAVMGSAWRLMHSLRKDVALTHYSLTGESRGTSFCLELPTPGGFVNFSTVSVGKWLVLPLDCLLIYLRKKDPSRGGLGSFVFTPVCPRPWLCMAWTGFFVQSSVGVSVSIRRHRVVLRLHGLASRFLYDDSGQKVRFVVRRLHNNGFNL